MRKQGYAEIHNIVINNSWTLDNFSACA